MKIAVLEPLGLPQSELKKMFDNSLGEAFDVVYCEDRKEDKESLIERSSDAEVVVLSNIPYNREIMKDNPNLKMICVAFTGFDHIDLEYCKEHNITVSNASGYANTSVAELVMGLVLNLSRNILSCDYQTRNYGVMGDLQGFELNGKIFGIIGLGAIGKTVAKIAHSFGCKVIAYNRGEVKVDDVDMVELDYLISNSDIISLHVPLTNSTRGMIGAEEFSLMKSNALLINTTRGPVVDNIALSEALKSGKISGAGIDVFDMEPPLPKDYPLLSAPNTILTPHIGFASNESMIKRAKIVIDNIKSWANGSPINVIL